MTSLLIDLNRGVESRKHRRSGMTVYMYVDQPGVYLNAFGKPVSEQLAKEAGFPIDELGRKRLAAEKLGAAMKNIEAELALVGDEKKIIASRAGYNVVDIGLGRARIEDEDGNVLSDTPVAHDYALKLLEEIAGPALDKAVTGSETAKTPNEKSKEKIHGKA